MSTSNARAHPGQPQRLDPDIARAESEGMVTEQAKLSAVEPPPEASSPARNPARPQMRMWTPGALIILAIVLAVSFFVLLLSTQ